MFHDLCATKIADQTIPFLAHTQIETFETFNVHFDNSWFNLKHPNSNISSPPTKALLSQSASY